MTESTSEYKKRIEEIKQSIENEPYMAKMREDIAEGISKTGIRQATVEEKFQAVIDETTGKDVISAPEIILARGGAQSLGERLNEEKAEVTAQLAHKVINQVIDYGKVILVAHRGSEKIAPENTIPAFEWAYRLGYEWIELDISDTLDNEIVVIHDKTVDRTTTGTGEINTLTLSQIKSFTVDGGANVLKYPNLKVPTLEEVFILCKKYGLKPVIEIKHMRSANFTKLIDLIKKYKYERNCLLLTSYIVYAENLRALNNVVGIMYLDVDVKPTMVSKLQAMGGVVGLGLEFTSVTKEIVDDLHSKGLFVNTWTVDSYTEFIRQKDMGVDLITTGLIGEVRT